MKDETIVILAAPCQFTDIIYNSLKDEFRIKKVILENPVSKFEFLKKRAKKIGLSKVFGQVLFRLLIVPCLHMLSRSRISEIKREFKLEDTRIDSSNVVNVSSVNADKTLDILRQMKPSLIIVNGTRIISNKILNGVPARFVNMHTGITPLYRGVHGAYWALVENNRKACGVTVHFVDQGIDTGDIVEQGAIEVTKEDSFVTYPLLQLAKGIPLLKKAIKDIFGNQVEIKFPPVHTSRVWSHPTLFEYIWHRIRYGVH